MNNTTTSQVIRAQISQAIVEEQANFRMPNYIRSVYSNNGTNVNEAHVQEAFQFIFQYIRNVPNLLEAFETAASQMGKSAEIQPFVRQVGSYFASGNDYLSDRYGLYGLMDDAFYACKMIELYSDAVQRKTGHALVPSYDLAQKNQFVASILGQVIAGRITSDVQRELSSTQSNNTMETLGALLIGGLVVGAIFNQFSGQNNSGGISSSSGGYWEDDMASGMAYLNSRRR